MYDVDLTLHILDQIHKSLVTITKRFEPVRSVNDFMDSPRGMEKLDAICMQLIVIGESLKNLDKVTDRELLKKYIIEFYRVKRCARCENPFTPRSQRKRNARNDSSQPLSSGSRK